MSITLNLIPKDANPNIGRDTYNENFEAIIAEFGNKISKDGSISMDSTFNMNEYRIVMLGAGVDPFDGINKQQFDEETNKYAEKNTIYVNPGYANSPPNSKKIGGKAVDPFTALGYITDATTENYWKIKLSDPPDVYVGDFSGMKDFVHIIGDSNPIVLIVEDLTVGVGKAKISTNAIIEKIRFKVDSNISQLILDGDSMKGEIKNCVFYFDDSDGITNPDLLLRGIKIINNDLALPSLGTITFDGTTESYVNLCRYSVDFVNPGNNDPSTINQKVPKIHGTYYNY